MPLCGVTGVTRQREVKAWDGIVGGRRGCVAWGRHRILGQGLVAESVCFGKFSKYFPLHPSLIPSLRVASGWVKGCGRKQQILVSSLVGSWADTQGVVR